MAEPISTNKESTSNNILTEEALLAAGETEECAPTYFVEKQEIIDIIAFMCENLPKKHDHVIENETKDESTLAFKLLQKIARFEKIVGQYQELSQLLKPHLEDVAVPLINLFAELIPTTTEELASVRDKAIVQFNPSTPAATEETPLRTGNQNDDVNNGSPQSEGANADEEEGGKDNNNNSNENENNNNQEENLIDAYNNEDNAALTVDSRLGQDFEEYELDAEKTSWHQASRLVCFVCKVVGFKSVIGFFPHDVKMLETCFKALQAWMRHPQARAEWEVRYCLLLWLSNLILVPFALNKIDSSASIGSLSSALLETALTFLGDSSKCRDGAALFIGRLLTRPDAVGHRSRLMKEAIIEMNVLASTGVTSHVRAGGVLHAAAITFKTGSREELVGFARMLIPVVAPVTLKSADARVCKTATKLLQRLGLALLPNRPQPWRYRKARTAFLGNQSLVGGSQKENATTTTDNNNSDETKNDDDNNTAHDNEEEEEETLSLAHLQQVEEVVDVLLSALGHQDTMVRYSAAKGLGRICERLPRDCADDIVSAIMDLENGPYAFREQDSNWHGATLALAEICRRYALLPSRFSQLVPLVEKALTYDVCKGSYSVGSHVRDAASYICWAAARSYNLEDLVDYVTPLSRALVTTALTDREVNVRRAASAAFQECAGRLGNFPHAIEIITTVDFFALANLRHALIDVAPKIAYISEYRTALFDRLLIDRIEHWSKDVREISAGALGILCNYMVLHAEGDVEKQKQKDKIVKVIIPNLCKQVLDSTSVNVRHGSVCALAEIVGRWNKASPEEDHLCKSCGTELLTLIPHLEAKRLFRGRGAEFIRQACCKLIENVSVARLTVTDKISRPGLRGLEDVSMRATMQGFFEETCKNPLRWLQKDGAMAMKAFAEVFYPSFNEKFHGGLLTRLVAGCDASKTPNERRGSCLMLGALPASILSATMNSTVIFDTVIDNLTKSAVRKDGQAAVPAKPATIVSETTGMKLPASIVAASTAQAEGEDAECREEAIRSLGQCCVTLLKKKTDKKDSSEEDTPLFIKNFEKIESAFLASTEDYATDRRGDIGLFVRLASLESYRTVWEELIVGTSSSSSSSLSQLQGKHLATYVNSCLKQTMEKIDRVRTVSTKQLHLLVQNALLLLCTSSADNKTTTTTTSSESLRVNVIDLLKRSSDDNTTSYTNDFSKLVQVFSALPEEHDFAAPSAAFDLVVPNLIPLPAFCPSIVDGLGASAGCLTPHVAQSALDSMVVGSTTPETKLAIAQALQHCFTKYQKSERMCVSVLLMTDRCLEKSILSNGDVLCAAVDACYDALQNFSKDIQRTLALIPILSSFARRCCAELVQNDVNNTNASYETARRKSWIALLALLATRFPKVRALASVELFTVFSALTDDVLSNKIFANGLLNRENKASTIEKAQEVLMGTVWDDMNATVDSFKTVRGSLFELLKMSEDISGEKNESVLKGFEAAGSGLVKAKKQVSELAMYKTLVAEKGF